MRKLSELTPCDNYINSTDSEETAVIRESVLNNLDTLLQIGYVYILVLFKFYIKKF